MIEDIEQLRDELASFIELLKNIISEGDRMSPQPDSLGLAERALKIFARNLSELDRGLEGKDVDSVVHAVLMTHADLRNMTECDLNWSVLWRRSDARERMRITTTALVNVKKIISKTSDLAAELARGR